ncbi:MAG: GGDEF domain-containing protein, partial [Sulfurimonadaceae bacterium]|nr:GGDEF domain-containing protein [Sulfurimonadaceae bacterium]
MNSSRTVLIHMLLPLSALALFFGLLYYETHLPQLFWQMLPILFYGSIAAAIAVSWHFNRSRFIFILLPLPAMLWAFSNLDTAALATLQNLLVPILMFHLLLFLFLKERGIFTLWGAIRLIVLLAES